MQAVIAKIKKNSKSEIVVAIDDFTSEERLDIREYYYSEDKKIFLPTKKGLALTRDEHEPVIVALEDMRKSNDLKNYGIVNRFDAEAIHVNYREYKGYKYSEIRIFVKPSNATEWKPTKKGVTFKHELIGLIIGAISQASDYLDEN